MMKFVRKFQFWSCNFLSGGLKNCKQFSWSIENDVLHKSAPTLLHIYVWIASSIWSLSVARIYLFFFSRFCEKKINISGNPSSFVCVEHISVASNWSRQLLYIFVEWDSAAVSSCELYNARQCHIFFIFFSSTFSIKMCAVIKVHYILYKYKYICVCTVQCLDEYLVCECLRGFVLLHNDLPSFALKVLSNPFLPLVYIKKYNLIERSFVHRSIFHLYWVYITN